MRCEESVWKHSTKISSDLVYGLLSLCNFIENRDAKVGMNVSEDCFCCPLITARAIFSALICCRSSELLPFLLFDIGVAVITAIRNRANIRMPTAILNGKEVL
jgi:hypothetical protein